MHRPDPTEARDAQFEGLLDNVTAFFRDGASVWECIAESVLPAIMYFNAEPST